MTLFSCGALFKIEVGSLLKLVLTVKGIKTKLLAPLWSFADCVSEGWRLTYNK